MSGRYTEPLIKMDVLVHNCSIFYAQLMMETAVPFVRCLDSKHMGFRCLFLFLLLLLLSLLSLLLLLQLLLCLLFLLLFLLRKSAGEIVQAALESEGSSHRAESDRHLQDPWLAAILKGSVEDVARSGRYLQPLELRLSGQKQRELSILSMSQ